MKHINVGDWIYAVRTNPVTWGVVVEYLAATKVTEKSVWTDTTTPAFDYRYQHRREEVFTDQRTALLAYRDKIVQLLLIMGRGLANGHITLESIDEQLVLGGE